MKYLSSLFKRIQPCPLYTNCEANISNSGAKKLDVWFEPWGHPFSLLPGGHIRVVAKSSKFGSLEVVEEEDLIAVYGWSLCSLSVYDGNELLFDLFELPDLGDGPGPRQVVEMLFGGPGGPK
jgi:hypothetical protein